MPALGFLRMGSDRFSKAGIHFFGEAKDREVSQQTLTAPAPSVSQALSKCLRCPSENPDKSHEIQYI